MIRKPYICKICGKPGAVEYEPTGDPLVDEFLDAFAGMLAHDHCVPNQPPVKQRILPLHPEPRLPHAD